MKSASLDSKLLLLVAGVFLIALHGKGQGVLPGVVTISTALRARKSVALFLAAHHDHPLLMDAQDGIKSNASLRAETGIWIETLTSMNPGAGARESATPISPARSLGPSEVITTFNVEARRKFRLRYGVLPNWQSAQSTASPNAGAATANDTFTQRQSRPLQIGHSLSGCFSFTLAPKVKAARTPKTRRGRLRCLKS